MAALSIFVARKPKNYWFFLLKKYVKSVKHM